MADLENGNGSETPLDEPSRKVQLIEVAVFLFLIVPSMAVSFFAVGEADLRFMQVAISSILNDLALLSSILSGATASQSDKSAGISIILEVISPGD
jgi:hypothetical protein